MLFSDSHKHILLRLAKDAIRELLQRQKKIEKPQYLFCERSLLGKKMPRLFKQKLGCFVTLTKNGALRGCIGVMASDRELYKNISYFFLIIL